MAIQKNNESKGTKSKLSHTLLFNFIIISIISIVILGAIWIKSEYSSFQSTARNMRKQYINDYKDMLKLEAEAAVDYINYKMAQTEERLRESIKARVYEAYAIAQNLYLSNRGQMTDDRLQDLVKDALRPIRFNSGRGYYFATDLDGIEHLFADRPELEGKNMLGIRGGKGEYVVRDMINLVKEKGEGFYRYYWSKPGVLGKGNPKIAFVKYFEPFNWFIGTGEYLEDVTFDIQNEVLSRIERIKFGDEGYVFAGTWEGISLSSPAKGQNMIEVADSNGVKIVQELIALAKGDGGFLSYIMPRFPGQKSAPNLSYVVGISDWKWYVVSGIYIDQIDAYINLQRDQTWKEIQSSMIKIVLTLAGLILVSVLISTKMIRKTQSHFEKFISFFSRAALASEPLNEKEMHWAEFETLALSANQMLSARENARKSLVKSEAKYRRLFERANDAIFVIDKKNGCYLDANDAALKLVGRLLDDLKQLTTSDVTSRGSQSRLGMLASSNNPLERGEVNYMRPDGSERIAELSIVPLDDEAVYGIAHDITDRKKADELLRVSEERFRILVEESPLAISLMDEDGNYIYLNPKFSEIFGYNYQDIPNGRKWFRKAYPDTEYRKQVISTWINDKKRADVGESRPRTFTVTCNNGTQKIIHFRPTTMESGDQLVIYEDITEKQRFEARLQQAQKMEAIGTLAGGISHDFNNILLGIQGRTSLIMTDTDFSHPNFEHLKSIEEYIKSASDLTRQILGFARGGKYEVKPIAFNDLIVKSSEMFGRTKKEITIHNKLQEDLWAIEADSKQLEQVLLNLYINAWQAMPAGGALYLETKNNVLDENDCKSLNIKPGRYVHLSVTDTGLGMDETTKHRIFDPFFTTKEMGRGIGLGLASVYGIITNHNGIITVDSQKERGATFNIYLPASDKEVTGEQILSEDLVGGKEKILFIDDEQMVIDVGKSMLEKLGYQVFCANSGREAIELFKKKIKDIDLVILDLIMPDVGGEQVFNQIKELAPKVRVLLSSGYSINGEASKILKNGCDGFIQKPFNLNSLSQKVRSLFGESGT